MTRRSRLLDRLQVRVPDPTALERERHASWLELFFDLIFVLALVAVTRRLGHNASPTIGEIASAVGLYVVVQWAWLGVSLYDTRFDPDDTLHRLLVMLATVGAGAMALGVEHAPESGFLPIGFLIVWGSVLLMYLRVRGSGPAGRISTIYLRGFGAGWLIWLGSLGAPSDWRPMVWAIGLAIDLLTPWVALHRLARYPVHPTHLPERIGQFTIILLGSTLFDLVGAVPPTRPTPQVLAAAVIAFVIPASIWWVYSGAFGRRPPRSRLRGGQVFIYLHIPFGASLLMIGWSLGQAVAEVAAGAERLSLALRLVLGGSLVARLLFGWGLHASSYYGPPARVDIATVLLGAVPITIITFTVADPFLTISLLAAVMVGYSIVTIRQFARRPVEEPGPRP